VHNLLVQFTYDTAGNRLSDLTHTNYQYNELNQLTEDDSCTYAYDADGNMTEKVSKSTGDTTYFVWDIENKLIEVRKPGTIARYSYDALGRRMSKEVNGVTTQFRYDGQDLILGMTESDSIIANYTFGPGIDDPLMMNRAAKNYYYTKDALGSVMALTDSTGSIVHEYKYSVFGEIVSDSGDTIENPFTYTSRELDWETGLMYYRARYYDPGMGRFLSEERAEYFNVNSTLYSYVKNSPIYFTDPSGFYEVPGHSNCLGYAMTGKGNISMTPNAFESMIDYVARFGWSCRRISTPSDCSCECKQKKMIITVFRNIDVLNEGKDVFNDPMAWEAGSDFHAMRGGKGDNYTQVPKRDTIPQKPEKAYPDAYIGDPMLCCCKDKK
jgi:RHS repeat-associated protein